MLGPQCTLIRKSENEPNTLPIREEPLAIQQQLSNARVDVCETAGGLHLKQDDRAALLYSQVWQRNLVCLYTNDRPPFGFTRIKDLAVHREMQPQAGPFGVRDVSLVG